MATASTPEASPPVPRTRTLRFWGALLLVMFVLTSAVGGSLAAESSYLAVTLASHIGLALVTLGIGGYAASRVGPTYPRGPCACAGLAALSALGATLAGTTFLLGGMSNAALYAMVGFALLGIVASLLLVVLGGPMPRAAPAAPPA
jgi:hypothetical protein